MRIGNRQLKYVFKQVYIFCIMMVLVENYFAYYVESARYSNLARNHFLTFFAGCVFILSLIYGRQYFAFNDANPNLSFRRGWFFMSFFEKVTEIPKDSIRSYRFKGPWLFKVLVIRTEDERGKKKYIIPLRYVSKRSRQKLKKSLSRVIENNQSKA